MASSSHSVNGQNGVQFGPDPTLVREQLRRLVAHPLFTNSKRYPVLLTYTVEQTLLGNASELKERTIGVEAFGREPVYDVNLDPVVRTAAAEVRKRLSQYYYNPDHAGELVIELPIGSYVPTFREPAASHMDFAAEPSVAEKVESLPRDPVFQSRTDAKAEQGRSRLVTRRWIPITVALLVAALIGFSVGRVRLPSQAEVAGESSNMSRFWQPITATSSRVTYCLGAPTDSVDLQSGPYPASEGGSLNTYDVITLARSLVPLVPKNGQFRLLSASDTGFAQLREGPFVLIGAFDNPWTMRITQDLPMGFEYDNHVREVVDRKSTPKKIWTLQWQVPGKSLARDYAIVARLHDTVTGEPVIILAGILGEGTEAASEVVSNPAYLDAMLQKAPKNWDRLNLETVIEANVIDGHPGPPTVITVETW
ncbi:MAG: hypothetical protein ABSE96_23575 [Terracidiphilus sp.]